MIRVWRAGVYLFPFVGSGAVGEQLLHHAGAADRRAAVRLKVSANSHVPISGRTFPVCRYRLRTNIYIYIFEMCAGCKVSIYIYIYDETR